VTVLAFYTAVRLLEDRVAALFATLVFGLHPVHAEAVECFSDPLFAIFVFASYLCYLKKRSEPAHARAYLAASLGLYALASLSKETAVVLPFIIFACEFLWHKPASPSRWGAWIQRFLRALAVTAPYVALFAVYTVARILALQGFQNPKESHSFAAMFLTWPRVLWFYVHHLIWPTRLAPFYSVDFCTRLDARCFLLPAIPVGIVTAGLWWWGRRSPKAAVATIWLVVPILPVLNLRAFVEGSLVHDRYLYLPSFGFGMLLALGLRHLRLGERQILGQPVVQLVLASVVGLAMSLGIVRATACYANEAKFFTYVTSMLPERHSSKIDLAGELGHQGHVDEAIQLYKEVYPTEQNNWSVNYNLGYAYYLTGDLPDAERYLSRAVQLDSNDPEGHFYLGLTKLKMGDVNSAAANVQRAILIRPDAENYHFAFGVILKLQGNLPGALSEFHQEIEIDPSNASARQQAQQIEAALAAEQKGSSLPRQ
jgi:tetratricopeptide (TPR) repeat protein